MKTDTKLVFIQNVQKLVLNIIVDRQGDFFQSQKQKSN